MRQFATVKALALNKHMKKTQAKTSTSKRKFLASTAVLGIAVALVVGFSVVPMQQAKADRFDEEIKKLQGQNSQNQGQVSQLQNQASSYQEVIDKLQGQINQLQGQINDNQAKQKELQGKIDENQRELNRQRKVLGENIKVMYVDGQITTIEMLATSKNLSEFVDKEEYHTAVENKIQDTLKRIAKLQNELKEQKVKVEQLLKDQHNQQGQLDANRSEQSKLLALNQSQQSDFNQKIKDNKDKISGLRAQQAAENARLFGGGANLVLGGACDTSHGDTYPTPWCSAAQDSMIDSWGMYNRECVSYTAWKVSESGRHMPYWGGVGNANQWDDNARASGIPVDNSPRAGDVAIKNSGYYGHAMYVESVNSNGTINISQYNASLNGRFSRAYNVSAAGLVFIHF